MSLNSVKDIRRENLKVLVERLGSMKELNKVLNRTDNTLTQILNQSIHSKTKQPKQMGDRIARSIENGLNLEYGWMDADHSDQTNLEVGPEDESITIINELNQIEGASIAHELHEQDVIIGPLRVKTKFLQSIGYNNTMSLSATTAYGDSMSPTLLPGAKLLVDTSINTFVGNGIYVLKVCGTVLIKRISMKMNGKLHVSTDNPNETLSEDVENSKELQIVGRVVYYWNGYSA